jgi:hypothetical protein
MRKKKGVWKGREGDRDLRKQRKGTVGKDIRRERGQEEGKT